MVPSQHLELDRICDQVEQLLTRHDRLRRNHSLLQARLSALLDERTLLQQRVDAACGRIDAMLERLPAAELTPAVSTLTASMRR